MFLLLYIGPALIAVCFRLTQQRTKGGLYFLVSWLLVLVASATIGALSWKRTDESTQFAEALLLASPVILLGPLLSVLRSKSFYLSALCLLTVFVPALSVAFAILFILSTGQVWGM